MKRPKTVKQAGKTNNILPADAHHKKARKLRHIIFGLCGHLLLALAVTGWGLYDQHQVSAQASLVSLRQGLGIQKTSPLPTIIRSNVGFSVTYDPLLVHAQGVVLPGLANTPSLYQTGKGEIDLYNGKDLKTARDYGAVDFWTNGSAHDTALLHVSPVWQMEIVANQRANVLADGRKLYGAKTSDLDLAEKLFAPKTTTTSYNTIVPSVTRKSMVSIGGTSYRKVVYKMTDTTFPSDTFSQVQYLTVQNGRPYVVKLNISPGTAQGDIALLMNVLAGIRYTNPNSGALYGLSSQDNRVHATAALASTVLPSNDVNLPSQLDSNALEVVAKNQPGIVRVGTIACFNFNLLLPDGKVAAHFDNVCGAGVGSGSIISSDGYISTNGHVAVFPPSDAFQLFIAQSANAGNVKPLQEYINYLAASKVASVDRINSLLSAVKSGDNKAAQTLLNLTGNIPYADYQVTARHTAYAIQLSNDPIKYKTNGTNLTFSYNQHVIPASFVDANFDVSQEQNGTFDISKYSGSDVALLKMQGKDFPVVQLGALSDVHAGSILTAIGFPGFVDGGLDTTKSQTIPTATQGAVKDIGREPGGPYKVITATLPIAEGNSGGPGLNAKGLEIGLTTYALQSVDPQSGIEKLSSGSALRDISDIKALLAKHNITLNTKSSTSSLWNQEVDDFVSAHYKSVVKQSQRMKAMYPSNYLAASFLSTAQQEIKLGHDKSSPNILTITGGILTAIAVLAIAVVATILIKHRRHGMAMGYYSAQPVAPAPYNPAMQTVAAQPAPQNVPPIAQPPATAIPQPLAQPVPQQRPAPSVNQGMQPNGSPPMPGATIQPTAQQVDRQTDSPGNTNAPSSQ